MTSHPARLNIKEKDIGQPVLSINGICNITDLLGSNILIIGYDNYNNLNYNVIE